jgi:hypothetical protein
MDHPLIMFCPYPTVNADGECLDGLLLLQPDYCKHKCEERQCLTLAVPAGIAVFSSYTCHRGFSVFVGRISSTEVVRINGVIDTMTNTAPAHFRRQNRRQKVSNPELQAWAARFSLAVPAYNEALQVAAKTSIHALHDIKSLIGSILNTAELWVWEQPGESIDEKVQGSPDALRKIYQSCRLLVSLLQLTDILANPEVASFGEPRMQRIHGILVLLTRVHEDKATRRGITFRLKGHTYTQVPLYSSFIVLPHVLLDNAIKHSDPNTEIHIAIEDLPRGVLQVDISSCGDLIPVNERLRIFEPHVRGTNVKATGSGLGLYIARLVAKANGCVLTYRPEPYKGSETRGFNHFTFMIPTTGAPH